MSEQPRFWLKVTPAYVVENFDDMLRYLNEYNYEPAESADSDFNVTVDCLCEVARGLLAKADGVSAEGVPDWGDIPVDKGIRIVAAAMLAESKRKRNCHDLILGLVRLALLCNDVAYNCRRDLLRLVRACALKRQVRKISLRFDDIMSDKIFWAVFCTGLANTEFSSAADIDGVALYQGHGSIVFGKEGVKVVPMNLRQLEGCSDNLRPTFSIEEGVSVCDRKAKKLPDGDIAALDSALTSMIRAFAFVEPTPAVQQVMKQYADGERLDVRVVEVSGIKVVCESVSADYQKVKGKILIDPKIYGITRDLMMSQLRPGDILPAVYHTTGAFEFVLDHSWNDSFIEDFANEYAGEPLAAMYDTYYQFGTRWYTELGLSVNILDAEMKAAEIDMQTHTREGAMLKVKIRECRRDAKNKLVTNGLPLPESEQMLGDEDHELFFQKAKRRLTQEYINYFGRSGEDQVDLDSAFPHIIAEPQAAATLGLLVLKTGMNRYSGTTFDRMAHAALAALIMKACGRETDFEIARREFDYLKAIAGFAMGKSPISLCFNPGAEVDQLPHTLVEKHIIDVLRDYKESRHELPKADLLLGAQFTLVEDLVSANNILIDKIDAAEISRIKKSIAAKLGVDDVFRDMNQERTFYGMENDTLEFKISCVCPPENRRTGFEHKDAKVQMFNILRTVCAFLNAPAGGELLIGVNDDGYAVGLDNDISKLHELHLIHEPNIDRLGVYVKNQIDAAFVSNDGTAHGNAITVGNVTVNIEESKDHKQVLRVKINPYPYDVVRIERDFCIEANKNVYYRSSATSVPLDKDGVRNTRMRKLGALDRNEAKIARVLEAIDRQKVVMLHNYQSYKGLTDRKVEPHRFIPTHNAFQAFDYSSRQMRLFKLNRVADIEITNENWNYRNKHRSARVDIFGMMESDTVPAETIRLKMSDFALMLLREEHSIPTDTDIFKVERNTGADSAAYPNIVSILTFHPAGYNRFVLGLPDQIQIVS